MKNPNSVEYWNNKWALRHDQYVAEHKEVYEALKPYLKGEVLDVGCGNGYVGKDLGKNYHGIDQSEEGIRQAKEFNPEADLKVGDIRKPLPYLSKSFETVLASSVVEHLPNFNPLLAEIRRICSDKAVFIVPRHSYGAEHCHPAWDSEKIDNVFNQVGKIVEVRMIEPDEWMLVVVEVK